MTVLLPPLPEPDFALDQGDEPCYYAHTLSAHAAAVSADLAAENARLREALEKIAKSSPDELGCYYSNRRNIGIAIAALKGASHE